MFFYGCHSMLRGLPSIMLQITPLRRSSGLTGAWLVVTGGAIWGVSAVTRSPSIVTGAACWAGLGTAALGWRG